VARAAQLAAALQLAAAVAAALAAVEAGPTAAQAQRRPQPQARQAVTMPQARVTVPAVRRQPPELMELSAVAAVDRAALPVVHLVRAVQAGLEPIGVRAEPAAAAVAAAERKRLQVFYQQPAVQAVFMVVVAVLLELRIVAPIPAQAVSAGRALS